MAGGETQRPHFSQAYSRNPMWPSAASKYGLIKFKNFMGFWGPSAALWGASGFLTAVFITDWSGLAPYIPLYNRKFKKDE